jgi:hypothetical protein
MKRSIVGVGIILLVMGFVTVLYTDSIDKPLTEEIVITPNDGTDNSTTTINQHDGNSEASLTVSTFITGFGCFLAAIGLITGEDKEKVDDRKL